MFSIQLYEIRRIDILSYFINRYVYKYFRVIELAIPHITLEKSVYVNKKETTNKKKERMLR